VWRFEERLTCEQLLVAAVCPCGEFDTVDWALPQFQNFRKSPFGSMLLWSLTATSAFGAHAVAMACSSSEGSIARLDLAGDVGVSNIARYLVSSALLYTSLHVGAGGCIFCHSAHDHHRQHPVGFPGSIDGVSGLRMTPRFELTPHRVAKGGFAVEPVGGCRRSPPVATSSVHADSGKSHQRDVSCGDRKV
jgi:hypothetical protein